jgi:hypothetical protein
VSLERGTGKKRAGSRDCSKKSKNEKNPPKIEIFADVNIKNSNFSENLDSLPWIQKSLLQSKNEESMCVGEGELKIKFINQRRRGTKKKTENLK